MICDCSKVIGARKTRNQKQQLNKAKELEKKIRNQSSNIQREIGKIISEYQKNIDELDLDIASKQKEMGRI